MEEQIESGVKQYSFGDRKIFDMREAIRGKYEDKGLKTGDCVIWSDKKVYKVLKKEKGSGAMFLKLTKMEVKELMEDIDQRISSIKSKESSNNHLKI